MPKGSSFRPKWSRYNANRLAGSLQFDMALLARIEFLYALLNLGGRLAPRLLAADDRRPHQDDQFALAIGHALLTKQQAQAGHAADSRQTVAVIVLCLAHQAANRDNAAILDADDAVALVDAGRSQRQREGAHVAQIDVLGFFLDHADRGMDVQDDVAVVVDLRRHVECDAGKE